MKRIVKNQAKNPSAGRSIATTMALAFFALSATVLIVSGALQLFAGIEYHRTIISGMQQLIAQKAARTVSRFIQQDIHSLETAIRLTDPIETSPDGQKRILKRLLELQPSFGQIVLLDAHGRELAKATRSLPDMSGPLAGGFKNDALASVRNGKIFISPVWFNKATGKPLIIVAAPATDVFGNIKGAMAAEVNLDFMMSLFDRLKVGRSGHAYVVDRQGNLIALSSRALTLKGQNAAHLQIVRGFTHDPVSEQPHKVKTYRGINGSTVVGTYVTLGTPDWAVVTELPWNEAYRYIIRDVSIFTGITLAMALLAGIAGIFAARRLSAPLVGLKETATRIADGGRNLQAAVAGPREVADLAAAFNSMTAQLRQSLKGMEKQVTEIKQAEEALQQAHDNLEKRVEERTEQLAKASEALRISEERYALALQGANDVIWDENFATGEIYHSPRLKSMLGYTDNELNETFTADEWQELVHPDDRQRVAETRKAYLEGHIPTYEVEFRLRKINGEYLWFAGRGACLRDSDGRPFRMAGSLSDITGRKKLEQQLLQSQKMESIGLLAGGVAHDFNNLLTAIFGYGQIIRENLPPDNENLRECIELLLTGAGRAAELIGRLLAFSRKQVINPKPVLIDTFIDNTCKLIQRVIGEDIEFIADLTGKPLPVMADAGQIDQVLMNLATNARDAMPRGGRLTISTRREDIRTGTESLYDLPVPGTYAVITVADTGEGIDGESMKRLFEPFYTTKEVGKGTGLGLAVVYGIIKQHNGSVLVDSEPGKGTSFNIYLPLIEGHAAGERPAASETPAGGTETLLVVEDEELVKYLLKRTLERAGYSVITAGDGEEAMERFMERDDISLVLSDMVMPKKNGREMLDEIRRIKPGMKVIFISGYTADNIREKGITGDSMEFMTKPFTKNDLLRKVRAMLDE